MARPGLPAYAAHAMANLDVDGKARVLITKVLEPDATFAIGVARKATFPWMSEETNVHQRYGVFYLNRTTVFASEKAVLTDEYDSGFDLVEGDVIEIEYNPNGTVQFYKVEKGASGLKAPLIGSGTIAAEGFLHNDVALAVCFNGSMSLTIVPRNASKL
jgi:hypothetical protein